MMLIRLGILCALALVSSCRTSGESARSQPPQLGLTGAADPMTPLLKKVIGGLTKKYPDNRLEECVILRGDVVNAQDVSASLLLLKSQELGEAFIFRPQIPSIQYFGIMGGEDVLIQETGDEKMIYRRSNAEMGNPALEMVMAIFDAKCGAKDGKP